MSHAEQTFFHDENKKQKLLEGSVKKYEEDCKRKEKYDNEHKRHFLL
jgi:hypothetical protein